VKPLDPRAWDLAQAEIHDLRGFLSVVEGVLELCEMEAMTPDQALAIIRRSAARQAPRRAERFERTLLRLVA